MPEQRWFYCRESQTFGPFNREQIKAMATDGLLLPSDELWLEGHSKRLASDYKNLLPAAAPVEAFSELRPQGPETPAQHAPVLSSPTSVENRRNGVVLLAIFVIIVVSAVWVIWNLVAFNASAPPRAPTQAALDWATVKVVCEGVLRQQLKAPSTARFPNAFEAKEQIVVTGNRGVWMGWVDAQNSFGAMIRTGFTCTYENGAATALLLE